MKKRSIIASACITLLSGCVGNTEDIGSNRSSTLKVVEDKKVFCNNRGEISQNMEVDWQENSQKYFVQDSKRFTEMANKCTTSPMNAKAYFKTYEVTGNYLLDLKKIQHEFGMFDSDNIVQDFIRLKSFNLKVNNVPIKVEINAGLAEIGDDIIQLNIEDKQSESKLRTDFTRQLTGVLNEHSTKDKLDEDQIKSLAEILLKNLNYSGILKAAILNPDFLLHRPYQDLERITIDANVSKNEITLKTNLTLKALSVNESIDLNEPPVSLVIEDTSSFRINPESGVSSILDSNEITNMEILNYKSELYNFVAKLQNQNFDKEPQLVMPLVNSIDYYSTPSVFNFTSDSSLGLLDINNADVYKISTAPVLGGVTSFNKVNQNKPLFKNHPLLSDIYQTSNMNCGFMAALATVLATEGGATYIEQLIKEDNTNNEGSDLRNVYVKMFPEESDLAKVIKLDKERDWTQLNTLKTTDPVKDDSGYYRVYTKGYYSPLHRYELSSSAKLWVHMFERAFKALYTPPEEPTASVITGVRGIALHALTGKNVVSSDDMSISKGMLSSYYQSKNINYKYEDNPIDFIRDHDGSPMIFSIKRKTDELETDKQNTILDDKYSGHFYAIISKITSVNGREGVWVFDSVQHNDGYSYAIKDLIFHGLSSNPIFFVGLEEFHYGIDVVSIENQNDLLVKENLKDEAYLNWLADDEDSIDIEI